MKFKRIVIIIIVIIGIVISSDIILKKYVFPFKHKNIITKYSQEYNLDPLFVLSVIKAESKFKSDARSNKDAVGLMQITETTAEWIAEQMELEDFSYNKLYEEEYNIKMGCWYLNNLRNEFGDLDLVIAAYNAGRGKVNEWLNNSKYSSDGIKLTYIPYSETEKYVNKVNAYYETYKILYN